MIRRNYLHVFTILFLTINAIAGLNAQIPTHIDPGQNENPVNIYERPEYIVPIVALFILLIGVYLWRKRKTK